MNERFMACVGLTKNFGGVWAVKDLSFEVRQHEILGLIGPNGAGKTTVFNLITGFYKPAAGQILLDGRPLNGLAPPDIVALGVARTFQNIRLFPNLSVLDNVRIALHRRAGYSLVEALARGSRATASEKKIRETALSKLAEVGLVAKAEDGADSLAYGLQRKLEIARALALEPKLLLLDEPAAGMNPEESRELVELVNELHARYRLTIILIEHHMDVVMTLSRRIVVLNFGEKLAEGSPEEIQAHPEVIRAYLGEEYARAHHRRT